MSVNDDALRVGVLKFFNVGFTDAGIAADDNAELYETAKRQQARYGGIMTGKRF